MTALILPFPSRGLPCDRCQRRREGASPARQFEEVVRLDGTLGDDKDALQQVGPGDDRRLSALDLADVGLTAAEFGREPLLAPPLLFPPHRQLHETVSQTETPGYCDSLYFVNGHKQVEGAEYNQVAYLYAMHPGNRIRDLRKAKGLSQAELAQRTGVSQPYISQIENQDGLSLDIARMRALAREFDCAPADLLADGDNPDRLTEEERELLVQFRAADRSQQQMIRRVAEPLRSYDAGPTRAAG